MRSERNPFTGEVVPTKDDRPQLEIPAPPPPDEDWREHPEGNQPPKEERGVVIIGPDGSEQGEKRDKPKPDPGTVNYRC